VASNAPAADQCMAGSEALSPRGRPCSRNVLESQAPTIATSR